MYQNQKEIAPALKKAGVPRSELFLTSKLWNSAHAVQNVAPALEDTLKELDTDYLDLYLIHWPVAFKPKGDPHSDLFPLNDKGSLNLDSETTLVDTWKEMIKLKEGGKVKSIGVSNFSAAAIDALEKATGVLPAVNQIERHPLLLQPELLAYLKQKDILVTSYSPLAGVYAGKTPLVQLEVVKKIAEKHNATPAQVLISWGALGGHTVIPKSVTPDRIASNLDSLSVKLDDESIKELEQLGKDKYTRFNLPFQYKPFWDINVFGEPEEKDAVADVQFGI